MTELGRIEKAIAVELKSYLNEVHIKKGVKVAEVTGWREATFASGNCSTCWFKYSDLTMECLMEDETEKTISISESFTDLLRYF